MAPTHPLTTRRTGPFAVDAALIAIAFGVSVLVFAVVPSPEVCALSLPTPGPCTPPDRQQIALITIVSLFTLVLAGSIANHVLAGRVRAVAVGASMIVAFAVGLLGASSLAFSFWIIHPFWQFGLAG